MSTREQPDERDPDMAPTGLPKRRIGLPLQSAIDAGSRKQTGPLPAFDTDADLTPHVKAGAMLYLDDMRGSVSSENMIDNVVIQYGLTPEQASAVYREWERRL